MYFVASSRHMVEVVKGFGYEQDEWGRWHEAALVFMT